jgi:carbonic anhydrase
MSVTDVLLKNNERFATSFDNGDKPMPPARHRAVVACMDARLHVSKCSSSMSAMPTSSATRAVSSVMTCPPV